MSARWRPVVLAWLLVTLATAVPYLKHALAPPPGLTFTGVLFWREDMYQYLMYVQQAEAGAVLFRNKLLLEPHRPALLNPEWWLVGRLSAALGGSPLLAYRLFGVALSIVLVVLLDTWLRKAGLPPAHRLPALLLVLTGGGLGGIVYQVLGPPAWRSLDLVTGIFPFIELLANAHFVLGTTMLLAALLAFLHGRDGLGVALGTLLGLARPYDVVTLVAARGVAVLWTEPRHRWARKLLPLAGFAPVAAYLYWVFYVSPIFSVFFYEKGPRIAVPWGAYTLALAPAVALAALALVGRRPASAAEKHLLAWAAVGLAMLIVHPVAFYLQFLVGLGLPLLSLGALALARWRVNVSWLAAIVMSSTAAVATSIVLRPEPRWMVPSARMEAARALRGPCRDGGVLLAPPDIGLFAAGLTGCKPYVSERLRPPQRDADASAFYGEATAATRTAILDAGCITHLALPGDAGEVPVAWLGEGTPFRRAALVNDPAWPVSLYMRPAPASCVPR